MNMPFKDPEKRKEYCEKNKENCECENGKRL